MTADAVGASLTLSKGRQTRVGAARIALLEAIRDLGSIKLAAESAGLSYKGAWDAVQATNNLFGKPLVTTQAGGRHGGAATLTASGQAVVEAFHAIEGELGRAIDRLERQLGDPSLPALKSLLWSLEMKTSVPNALRGVITQVTDGAVNSEVTLRIAPGVEIVAIVTRQSAVDLGLAPGAAAIALIQAGSIILTPGDEVVRTSARNQLTGVVTRCEDGAVNSEVTLELAAGKTLTATITLDSRRVLGLAVGDAAHALIKASHVILALE